MTFAHGASSTSTAILTPTNAASITTVATSVAASPPKFAPAICTTRPADHAATLISSLSLERVATEERQSFATGQAAEFRAQELATGVDSDAELQRLLLVEQAFGANARMIQTIDDMLDTLLRI